VVPETDAAETWSDANAPTKRGETFASARGLLPYPTEGRLVEKFGADAGGGLTNRGITLAASVGGAVVAPYDGHIAYVGSFRGYGRVLIIDHGGHYHSLLAGLEGSDGVVGQWVLAGEPIGTVAAATDAEPALYVEFWHQGEPVDPLPWFAPGEQRVAEATPQPSPASTAGDGGDAQSLARLERLAAAAALDAERTRIFRSLPKAGTDDELRQENAPPAIASEMEQTPVQMPTEPEPMARPDGGPEPTRTATAEHVAVEPEPDTVGDEPPSASDEAPSQATTVDPSEPEPETRVSLAKTGPDPQPSEPTSDAVDGPNAPTPEPPATPETEPKTGDAEPANGADPEPDTAPAEAKPVPADPEPAQEPTSIAAVSAYRIQVAAMRSAEAAEQEWQRVQAKNRDVLGSLEMTVTPVDLGAKGTFYRVRAGHFADRAAARTACDALARRRVPCLVVSPER